MAGSQDGLQRIGQLVHIATLAGIGKREREEIGIYVLIYLAISLLISCWTKFTYFRLVFSILCHLLGSPLAKGCL